MFVSLKMSYKPQIYNINNIIRYVRRSILEKRILTKRIRTFFTGHGTEEFRDDISVEHC